MCIRDSRAPAPADGRRTVAPPRLHPRGRRRHARRPLLGVAGRAATSRGGDRRPSRLARLACTVRVLVVNAGASSLKLRLLDGDDELDGARDLALNHGNIDDEELHAALAGIDRADAVSYTHLTLPTIL